MKFVIEPITVKNSQMRRRPLVPALLFLVVFSSGAFAQTVIAPLGSNPTSQPQTEQLASQQVVTDKVPDLSPSSLQWGPITARPGISYRYVSATGVQIRPGHHIYTTIQTVAPDIFAELGTHWTLYFQPSWIFYSNRELKDAADQAATLDGATEYEDWTFRFSQGYLRTFESLVETGQQTRNEVYTTTIGAFRRLNSRFMLETEAVQTLTYTTNFNNSKEWSLAEWLHRLWAPQLDTAIGVNPGYVKGDGGADTDYFQLLGKIDWRPGEKLSFHLDGGLDTRKLHTGNAGYSTSPIVNASARYQLFEYTVLNAEVSRKISVSRISSQTFKSFTASFGVEQRLLERLELILAVGYEKANYGQVGQVNSAARDDNERWYDARLSTTVLKQLTAAVFYHRNVNSSSVAGYSFTSDQVGVELRYQY